MSIDFIKENFDNGYEKETGFPIDKGYLECGLPTYLQKSLEQMKAAMEKLENGEEYYTIDCDYCCLQSDINCAEVNNEISEEQAWYLRETYLGLGRPGEDL